MASRPAADSAEGLPACGAAAAAGAAAAGAAGSDFLLLGSFGSLGLSLGLFAGFVLFGLDGRGDLLHHRGGSGGAGRNAGTGLGELLAELVVLLVQAAKFNDDLVQEVINFILVVALAELGRLKALVDNVFWRQSHLVTSLVWLVSRPSGRQNYGT